MRVKEHYQGPRLFAEELPYLPTLLHMYDIEPLAFAKNVKTPSLDVCKHQSRNPSHRPKLRPCNPRFSKFHPPCHPPIKPPP